MQNLEGKQLIFYSRQACKRPTGLCCLWGLRGAWTVLQGVCKVFAGCLGGFAQCWDGFARLQGSGRKHGQRLHKRVRHWPLPMGLTAAAAAATAAWMGEFAH